MNTTLSEAQVIEKVKEGVLIRTLDGKKELTVSQVIGFNPSVGFNFSGQYTDPAGIDGRTGQAVYGGRGFLYSDYNKKWTFANADKEEPVLKKFRVYGSYMSRKGLECYDMIIDAVDEKEAREIYYKELDASFYRIRRVELVGE